MTKTVLALSLLVLSAVSVLTQSTIDSGTLLVSLINRPVGKETYELKAEGTGFSFTGDLDLTERGGRLQVSSALKLGADLTPTHFAAKGKSYRFVNVDTTIDVADGVAKVTNLGVTKSFEVPKQFFTANSYSPLAARALLVRYWEQHGKPARLAVLPGEPTRDVSIEYEGVDTVRVGGKSVKLRRYSVDGVVWGRETVWLDEASHLAGIVSRIHILPLEAIREDLKDALPALQASAIQDRVNDLARDRRQIAPIAQGEFRRGSLFRFNRLQGNPKPCSPCATG